jgi:hypothetical protein
MDVVHGGQPSPSLLLKFAPLVRPVARSSFVPGLPVPQVATSPHPSADRCKGKDKIFHQQDFLEPGAGRSSSPDYPPGFGPHNLAHFTLGPTITGPIIHGPTTHGCYGSLFLWAHSFWTFGPPLLSGVHFFRLIKGY